MQTTPTTTTTRPTTAATAATAASAAISTVDARERLRELLLQGLVGVEVLLDEGRRTAAAAALRTLLDRADPALAGEVVEHAAVRELARQAAVALPRTSTDRYVPAGRVTRRRAAPRAADPRRREGDAATVAYLAEQGPEPVESSGWNEPVWGELDYDLAAVPGLRGAPCLGCRLERTVSDLANPDGLCVDCRDGGLTRERVIQRCCALVAERNTGARAVELLRRAWTRATRPGDRAVIAAWVAQHEDLITAAS